MRDEQVGIVGLENEFSVGADGWVKIAPYGDSIKERQVRHDTGTRTEIYLQRLDKPAAYAMVRKFNSLLGKLKRFVVGVPIYKRHPDLTKITPNAVATSLANDASEYGMFAALEAREDGFYGQPVITPAGKIAIENEGLKFLSPHWWALPIGKTSNGYPIMSPIELISAGLTDRPNIPGGEALANERQRKEETMKQKLISLMALFGIALANDASDEKIEEGLKQLETKAKEATGLANEKTTLTTAKTEAETALANEKAAHTTTRTNLEGQLTEARTALANERKSRIELMLDVAILQGRITPAEKPQWASEMERDFAGKSTALANEAVKVKTTSLTANLGARKGEATKVNDAQSQLIALANERMATAKCSWQDAWGFVTRQNPGLLEELKPASN
jgi:hypothetical protein